MQKDKQQVKIISTNRKAHHLYHILESYEAGIALVGTEVKSLRLGRANLKDSYAMVKGGEVYLNNLYISPYDPASRFSHDPTRTRKLLLHRTEIKRLLGEDGGEGTDFNSLEALFQGKSS
jgi:SsrA-binding protein